MKLISADIVLILSLFFLAVEVKVRNITKHLCLSPDVSRCDSRLNKTNRFPSISVHCSLLNFYEKSMLTAFDNQGAMLGIHWVKVKVHITLGC